MIKYVARPAIQIVMVSCLARMAMMFCLAECDAVFSSLELVLGMFESNCRFIAFPTVRFD